MFLLMLSAVCAEQTAKQDSLFCNMFGICDIEDGKKLKRAFLPRMDSSETKTHYRIALEIPGIAVKDIKVETEHRVLYISGEKKQQIDEKDQKQHRKECLYGEFKREFVLPEDALTEGIQATCKEHVLTILIPKKPSDRKTIAIQTS